MTLDFLFVVNNSNYEKTFNFILTGKTSMKTFVQEHSLLCDKSCQIPCKRSNYTNESKERPVWLALIMQPLNVDNKLFSNPLCPQTWPLTTVTGDLRNANK